MKKKIGFMRCEEHGLVHHSAYFRCDECEPTHVSRIVWTGMKPIGHAINRGGPHGIDTRSDVFGVAPDPLKDPNCSLCLVRFLDGTLVSVRYRNTDINIGG